jgi:hypothetical protein
VEITNLKVLKRSRKELNPGDIFAFQIKEGEYMFGRVIRTDAMIHSMEDCILIYIYNDVSKDKNNIPKLDKNNLLIPPIMTNKRPWTMGYFETIDHKPLIEVDVLQPHCFRDPTFGKYYDEYNNELPSKIKPCGMQALHSYRTIDDEISDALGIPLAPD